MKSINILIKPVSGSCQMKCKYCFYFDEANCREIPNFGKMDEKTTKNLIKKAFLSVTEECTFGFQGGEPTLAGLEYFRFFVKTVKEENKKNLRINYALQTNGYSINDEWAIFFKENNFLVGVSLDGPEFIHDQFRIGKNNEKTHPLILSHIKILQKRDVDINILSVVTGLMADNAKETYNYLKTIGSEYIQFIPCIDSFEENNPQSNLIHLSPEQYGNFLIQVFDLWYEDLHKGSDLSIRWFDDLVIKLSGKGIPFCQLIGHCTKQYVVEADGEFYPCDFFVFDKYKLGNINKTPIKIIDKNRDKSKFIQESLKKSPSCLACKWQALCGGGCRRDRQDNINDVPTNNRYCKSYKMFFEKEINKLQVLAKALNY